MASPQDFFSAPQFQPQPFQPPKPQLPTTWSQFGQAPQVRGQQQSSGGSYFSSPDLVRQLSGTLGGTAQGAAQQYLPFVSNPTAHPYFQNALSGLLQALVPSENAARTSLADQFRSAGNMSSGIFGNQATNLEGELDRNRNATASQLLTTMFPQIIQALSGPMAQINPLIEALKLQRQQSSGVQYSDDQARPELLRTTTSATGGPGNFWSSRYF